MIKLNSVIVYASILLLTALSFSLSKPATSNGILPKIDVNKINSSEESDYRSNYATKMLSFMNHSVHPCNDFYEYACGNWKNVIEERVTTKKRSYISDIEHKLAEMVDNILQRSHINDVAPEYAAEFQFAQKFYNSCLLAELHPMRASPQYLSALKKIGGFPAVDTDWNSENFHWLNMSAHISNYGITSFVNEGIIPQHPFPPYFKMPNFGFDMELRYATIKNSSSKAYKENEKRIRNILTIYGVEKNYIDNLVVEIFGFLKEILRVIQEFIENGNKCSVIKSNIKDTWRIYNKIAWLGRPLEKHMEWHEECCTPCFFLYEKLDEIFETNKRAAANYLSLKFLFHMDARLVDKKHQKDFCISNIKESMKYFFDHLYMKMYFGNEIREEVSNILKEIRNSLRTIIKEATWLDEPTRTAALLKEFAIAQHIGRYENINITKHLLRELKKLQFINDSYDANFLNLCKFNQYMKRFIGLHFEKLGNTTKDLYLLFGMQPNSFYNEIDNSIYVMAGFLNEPVYNKAWPKSLKFGTLGSVLGHELSHGFDTIDANFDKNSNNIYWWSSKLDKAFKQRTKCYVDHYNSYLIPEINRYVKGNLTKNENIADSVGLRVAFMAYRRYMENVATSAVNQKENMSGIDLSPEQLFFLGFAQIWCASYKEANYWEELMNEHVINKYRVLGTLTNSDDFSKVYNCTAGSKMNPTRNKCEIW